MSLDPSPLSSRPTPLLNPTDPVPGRGSALIGALIAVALAVVVVVVSVKAGTSLLFLPQGLNAQARSAVNQLPQIQGFNYYWTGSYDAQNVLGYNNSQAAHEIMQDEAHTYHMNLVVVAVTADQDTATGTTVSFHQNEVVGNARNVDTYADATYTALAQEALHNGLTPVFRLDVRVLDDSGDNPASTNIGSTWQNDPTSIASEQAWFNSYTQFAVHYALLAQKLNMPLFIIGHDLDSLATDSSESNLTTTPKTGLGGDPGVKCYGRRDCEWRHVIGAVHAATYPSLASGKKLAGANYAGLLTFAATVTINISLGNNPEWQTITFWDALDLIGLDAFFPLTTAQDASAVLLQDAWHGREDASIAVNNSPIDFVAEMAQMAQKYQKHILFTGAGYESLSGSNKTPGTTPSPSTVSPPDNTEQASDMQALLNTFQGQTWWLGVIWSSEYPAWPRSSLTYTKVGTYNTIGPDEPSWSANTEWAGDCPASGTCPNPEKGGGVVLQDTYPAAPLPDTLWENLKAAYIG